MEKNTCLNKKDIISRLNRIEGQIKGIGKMVEEEKGCTEILIQIAAVRAALKSTGNLMIKNYCKKCFEQGDKQADEILCEVLKLVDSVIN